MIAARRIEALSPEIEALCDQVALDEIRRVQTYKLDIIKNSTRTWLISSDGVPVFVFGIQRGTWLGWGVEMWFLPCNNVARSMRRAVPFARRGMDRIQRLYGHAKSTVAADFITGQRFVEFFGFKRIGELTTPDNKKYFTYEKRSPWLQQ